MSSERREHVVQYDVNHVMHRRGRDEEKIIQSYSLTDHLDSESYS